MYTNLILIKHRKNILAFNLIHYEGFISQKKAYFCEFEVYI